MQMYIFPGPSPDRSSGLDHDVLLHELTHGTSNRLHNNATGLNTAMSAGMGEGWSDFYARALLSTADEDPDGIYTTRRLGHPPAHARLHRQLLLRDPAVSVRQHQPSSARTGGRTTR